MIVCYFQIIQLDKYDVLNINKNIPLFRIWNNYFNRMKAIILLNITS